MRYLEEKTSNISTLIENQFPQFVQENNQKFLNFLSSYYESLEVKYQPLDIAANLIDYYNIGYYRPHQLVSKTKLVGNLLINDDTITVDSTVGFPDKNGYIKINNEIVFYRSISDNQFLNCVRGTSALILENIPKSEIILKSSNSEEHKSGSIVENIAYSYALEFFNRIKFEIAPLITENVVDDLDFTQFLKNIKSFYSAKGSLNGHRIIFKILFNDKKYNFILKPRGSGGKLKINNFNRTIPIEPKPQIVSGGEEYDFRKDPITNKLLNPPIIDIIGSGTGSVNSQGLRPNNTAIVKVTDINSSGSIVDVEVVDPGEEYIGPIKSKIRPRLFKQDQRVYNSSGTGYGRVDYWDGFRNELVLYDVVGFFKSDDEIIGIGFEEPRAFISRVFIGTNSIRDGIEVIPEIQNIEFPKEYTFKTSESNFISKKIIKCKILRGEFFGDKIPTTINLIQDQDSLFGVSGVNIESDNIILLRDNTLEIEIGSNTDIDNIYLPPSSEIIKFDISDGNNFVITVDDASRFPITNGIICINKTLIEYRNRSFNQFFDCKYYYEDNTTNLLVGSKVVSWGRKKYNIQWNSNEQIKIGEFRYFGDNLYKSITNGKTGSLPPTHQFGIERDGSFQGGDLDPVSWQFIDSNLFKHTFYVKSPNVLIDDIEFELLALPGDIVVIDGGALHVKQQYEFSGLKSPNTQMFNFTTSDISNRLALLLSSNFNRGSNVVSDERFPSWKSLTGFSTLHDYEDYIYVPTSTIPPWWDEIVDITKDDFDEFEEKKISFTNQKLVSRWKKTNLIFDTNVVTNFSPTKKSIGLNIDGIQLNSYKGNTINYGKVDRFIIGDGGNYKVPIKSDGNFDFDKFPSFVLRNSSGELIELTNQYKLVRISAGITKINFNDLLLNWNGQNELTGFTSPPLIEVINNNPKKSRLINSLSIFAQQDKFEIQYEPNWNKFDSGDVVTYLGAFSTTNNQLIQNAIPNLIVGNKYYIRKISDNLNTNTATYTLFSSETDFILNSNKVSLNYISELGNFNIKLVTEPLNPPDFQPAELDISFNQSTGSIDNIIIRNSGKGYVESPTIKIIGGGRLDTTETIIPYKINDVEIIEMRGNLISFENYYKINSFEIDSFNAVGVNYSLAPRVSVDNGSGAEASVYVANGSIATIVLIRKGKNYFTQPTVRIIGNGRDAVVEAIIDNGEIVGFNIINAGTGYTLQPKIEIVPSGFGAVVSSKLKEWTFNLVNRFSILQRLDDFGGYVYDESDKIPTDSNPDGFVHVMVDHDLPPSSDNRQYLIVNNSDKLLAKYTIAQREGYLNILYPGITFNYKTQSEIDEVLSTTVHSPILSTTYDGSPLYGKKGYSIRYDNSSPLIEVQSRYKLKYSTINSDNSVSYDINGTTYYVNRDGGPSILEYPIGSFIEDYEFIEGGDDELDIHNGRFCVTPEFPEGRYCYFATKTSFDNITNKIIEESQLDFGGFPYFIGDSYAGKPDIYPNRDCRTNDKIPKFFTRIFEKEIPGFKVDGIFEFGGFPENSNYPRETLNYDKTISRSSSLAPGSVDSIIIESGGSGYKVGDRLIVDNNLAFGSGLSGFVSKISGKNITSIEYSPENNEVSIITSEPHGLTVGDYVYFDYNPPKGPINLELFESESLSVSSNINESSNLSLINLPEFANKKIYTISLNFKFVYNLIIPSTNYKFTLDIQKANEIFVGELIAPNVLSINVSHLPNIVYLHIGDYIYEIYKSLDYSNEYRVSFVDNTLNLYKFKVFTDASQYETLNIFYDAKTRGSSGSIKEITISNGGSGYRRLPSIEVESADNIGTGIGAIVQANSNSIGKIRNIEYVTPGGGFISNINVNHYLNLSTTAKIINNFEIYEVEVINGGIEYKDTLKILVNGSESLAKFKINVQIGVITSIEVIDGGSNFTTIPTVQVLSETGIGAVLKAKIRRKEIFTNQILKGFVNSEIFPIVPQCVVVNYDNSSSTIEFDELMGQFKENDILVMEDGSIYGKVVSIRRPTAYAKVNAYTKLETSKTQITGNPSEFLQKITDSNFYQDWSYMISSSRDTIEWRNQVELNTHPAGHNLFGRKIIERRKFFFDKPDDVFKTSAIFTTNFVNTILLKIKQSPCIEQRIAVPNVEDFEIGEFIFGSVSESIGRIVDKTEYTLIIELRSENKFIIGDYLIKVPAQFAFGLESSTNRSLCFWNGIMQEPDLSYESAFNYNTEPPTVGVLIPKFDVDLQDIILHYKTNSGFIILDSINIEPNQTVYTPTIGNQTFEISQDFLNRTIISISGVVQNPATLEVNYDEKYIRFAESSNFKSKVFSISSPNINTLEFSGNDVGTTYNLNYNVVDSCQLLIFYTGVHQTELITNFIVSDNTIIFDEEVEKNKIFGWYLNDTVDCSQIDVSGLISNRVYGTWGCTTKQFTKFIHSSAVKTPTSLYEIKKEYLDGTIYPDTDGVTLYGFDTKFTYTSPEYSKSFVEVLEKINFDGSSKSFQLTRINGIPYSPINGKDSLMVYIDNIVLDLDDYQINDTIITFNDTYPSSSDCTIIDFNSSYIANQSTKNSANLDRLDVQHNGVRKTFNLSDRGVPHYVKNVGDIFSIRNGVLQRPDKRHQTVDKNKISFLEAPNFEDTTDLVYFNRQLLPLPTKNVVLDDFRCFDGIRTDFPLTIDGIVFIPVSIYHLFVVRNGVYQKHGIDYRLGDPSIDFREDYPLGPSNIIFSTAPKKDEDLIIFYSYDSLNQNYKIDNFKYFNGINKTFALTRDYISTTPYSDDHIQVYRNGVYQYSDSDYILETTNGGPRITFTTAPSDNEDVFITEFNSSNNFTNIRDDLTQISAEIIGYSGTLGELETLLIYKNGILQVDSWQYDYDNQQIIFNVPFTLDSQTRVFKVTNSIGMLDKFFVFDGIETTFPLTKNVISRTPYSDDHIQVYRNGVYQYSDSDYILETTNGGPRITFTTAPLISDKIFITNFHSNVNFADITSGFTQLSASELQYSDTLGSSLLLIFKDGIIQVGNSWSYDNSTEILTFTEQVDLSTHKIKIYSIGSQSKKLDPFYILDGTTNEFSLTKNYVKTAAQNSNQIQVYRNGVYQYPESDYTIGEFDSGNTKISFVTNPTLFDDIFITEFTDHSKFEDITSNFIQDNATTLGNIGTLSPTKTLLIYNQGILQRSDSYTYDYNAEKIIFNEPFNLNLNVKIFSINDANGILDKFYVFDGITTTFPLTYNNNSIVPLNDYHIKVYRNGVYQYPSIDYTTSSIDGGPRIIFTNAPLPFDNIFITKVEDDEIFNLTDDFTQLSNTEIIYTGGVNISTGLILIYKNGIIQNADSWSFDEQSNLIEFNESIDLSSDEIVVYHLQNSITIDRPRVFNGNITTFPLTKNNQSITSLQTGNHVLVYRNGVYQYFDTDYTVETTNGGPRITFTTAPNSSEQIFIQNFNTVDNFENITEKFTQINDNTLQYDSSLEDLGILVFFNGILQVGDSWSYNFETQRIIFNESVFGEFKIFKIKNCPVILNEIYADGQSTYQLRNGRKLYSPISAESLIVSINGVVQESDISYSINGSTITFDDSNIISGSKIYVIDCSAANLIKLDDVRTLWLSNNNLNYRLLSNYQSLISNNKQQYILVRNGVVQDPSNNDFTILNSVLTIFNYQSSDVSELYVYFAGNSGMVKLDDLKSIIKNSFSETIFRLTKNYQTVNVSTDSTIVSLEGVVQRPSLLYTTNGSLLTFKNYNINFDTLDVIDASGASLQLNDDINDYIDTFIDENQKIHNRFIIRNSHPQLQDSIGVLVSYGSVVQKPNVDYLVYTQNSKKIFEIITNFDFDQNQLYYFDVSKSNIELLDNLESLIFENTQNRVLRLTSNYQTISNLSAESVLIAINGVVQQPYSSFNIINSTISLFEYSQNYLESKIYNFAGANLRLLDYISETFETKTLKLLQNYLSFTPSDPDDLFVLRESVLQNPSEDFVTSTGKITFTTALTKDTDIFILYTHGSEELTLTEIPRTVCYDFEDTYLLPYEVSENEKNSIVLYFNGVPRFHQKDFSINGNIITLNGFFADDNTVPFAIKYTNLIFVDDLDDCPDGQRTRHKLLYQGKNIEAKSIADILVNRLGVIQRPLVDFNIEFESLIPKWIDFVVPLMENDKDTFFVRMYENRLIQMNSVDGSTSVFTSNIPVFDNENLYIFANGNWILPTKDYTYDSINDQFILNTTIDSDSSIFAIEFTGIVKLLDDIHTPYNSNRKIFNMFLDEENFVPAGTIENENIPDETSILIIKNGTVLDPKVDYTLTGDILTQINFVIAPSPDDTIMVKSAGSFIKLDTIVTGFNNTKKIFDITNNLFDYYPNADIARPREHENQILVIKDGYIQSPIYDYYIDNNKLIFLNSPVSSTNKIVMLDFRGTKDDVKVFNRLNQIKVGDELRLDGSSLSRVVTEIISPTVMKTTLSTESVHYGFSAVSSYDSGKITNINVLNGGIGYTFPAIVRTKGTGQGAKSVGNVNLFEGGSIQNPLDIQYPGYNIYRDQEVFATVYGYTYREQQLSKSQIRKGTILSSNINSTTEVIPIANSIGLDSNPPTIDISSDTGSGATFRIYVSKGQVRKIDILTQGIGYDERTFVIKLEGNGTGCVLEPILDAMGSLIDVIIRNPGVGYDTFRVIVYNSDSTSTNPVNAEIIEYTYVIDNILYGCTRGIVGSPGSHSQGDYVYFDNYL